MSDKREFKQTDTSTNAKMDSKPWGGDPLNTSKNAVANEPGLPVKIPLSIVRWVMYSCFMSAATLAFLSPPTDITIKQWLGLSAILGHFASQLNAIIKK